MTLPFFTASVHCIRVMTVKITSAFVYNLLKLHSLLASGTTTLSAGLLALLSSTRRHWPFSWWHPFCCTWLAADRVALWRGLTTAQPRLPLSSFKEGTMLYKAARLYIWCGVIVALVTCAVMRGILVLALTKRYWQNDVVESSKCFQYVSGGELNDVLSCISALVTICSYMFSFALQRRNGTYRCYPTAHEHPQCHFSIGGFVLVWWSICPL